MLERGGAICRLAGKRRAERRADEAAVARYIADMAAQLESMAASARLDLLAYFLAMARAESEASAGGAPPLSPTSEAKAALGGPTTGGAAASARRGASPAFAARSPSQRKRL